MLNVSFFLLTFKNLIFYYGFILDAPKILSAGPDRLTTAPLFSPAAFECVAEGNPPPTFKWVQK